MVVAVSVVLAGCGGGGGDGDGEPTVTTAGATTIPVLTTVGAAAGPATELTLRITDVRLVNSEESDNGVRILLPAGVASASVTVTGLPSPNRVVSVCQARELDRRQSGAACRMPANGEAATVALGSAATGVEIVQVGVAGAGPEANSLPLEEVVVRYAASSREVSARLAQIAGGEAGGRPTFAMSPAGASGAYRAKLSWTSIPVFGGTPSSAQVELLRDGTAAQTQAAGAEVQISGNASPPGGNLAIRIQNTGTSALVSPKVELLLP